MATDTQARLLTLCAIRVDGQSVDWQLLARLAQTEHGLDLLYRGEILETSEAARRTPHHRIPHRTRPARKLRHHRGQSDMERACLPTYGARPGGGTSRRRPESLAVGGSGTSGPHQDQGDGPIGDGNARREATGGACARPCASPHRSRQDPRPARPGLRRRLYHRVPARFRRPFPAARGRRRTRGGPRLGPYAVGVE